MSHAEKGTRVVVCVHCKRRHRNRSGTNVCGRCEDSTPESLSAVASAHAGERAYVKINTTAQGACSCCGNQTRIDPTDGYCIDCHKKRLQRGRLDFLKQKIRCKSCNEIKRLAYLNENICRKCVLTRTNQMATCIDCGKEKFSAVKKNGPCCLSCYQDRLAEGSLRNLLDNYRGPNHVYLTQLAERIDWNAVDEDMRRRFSVFAAFLQDISIPEPLTWEWLQDIMPSLGGENRKRAQAIRIRSCLWDLAYIQVAQGRLEERKSYLGRKSIQNLIEQVPEHLREDVSDHVDWMKQASFSPYTVYTRLINTKQFLNWCAGRGVGLHEITDFVFEEFEQFYRWQWVCTGGHTAVAYDVYGDTPNCACCGVRMLKTRWHTNPTVGIACDHIQGLLQWAFEVGLTREKITATARNSPTFRHYPADVIKQIIKYVASPTAHPIEAFVLYLITFHTCSVCELLHAQLLRDENGEVQSLSDARCIIIREREPSRGNLSTGRVEKRIEFDPLLVEWLTPLLGRVDEWRARVLKGLTNKYVLLTPAGAKHEKPVTRKFITNAIDRGCASAEVGHVTPMTLRLTAAAMFADAGVMGILELMGWSKQRAYQLGWIENRELVLPGVRKKSGNNNGTAPAPSGGISAESRASARAGERSGRKGENL
jgi:hypothetical protein